MFATRPGSTAEFSLPVTPACAQDAWSDFVTHRLPQFGDYEDAMLTGQPVMNHAFVSMLLNVGLLDPMKLVRDVESAYRAARVPRPYVASAAYINRMSDYCKACKFDPSVRVGDDACPFNYLFWTFLHDGKDKLRSNPRMTLMLKNAERIDAGEMRKMMRQRKQFIDAEVRGKKLAR